MGVDSTKLTSLSNNPRDRVWLLSGSLMNQRKVVSAGSWAAAIVALLLGAWVNRRPGSVLMRTAFFVALGLVTLFFIWIQSRSMTVFERLISVGFWGGTFLRV